MSHFWAKMKKDPKCQLGRFCPEPFNWFFRALVRARVNVNRPGSARISSVVFNGFLTVLATYNAYSAIMLFLCSSQIFDNSLYGG